MSKMDWQIVRHSQSRKSIGAVGFIGDKIAIIAAFYEDKDHNHDGQVQMKERFVFPLFSFKGKAVAEVAQHAFADPDIFMRDPSIYNIRGKALSQFGASMTKEAVYKIYFSTMIKVGVGRLVAELGTNTVKAFIIKNGLDKAVEAAYKKSVGL
jgi:hypothetical protein